MAVPQPTKKVTSGPEHVALFMDLCAVLKKHEDAGMHPTTMLAIVANFLGKLMAMQDQTKLTSADVTKLVNENIIMGNQQIVAELMQSQGQA